jgi:fused signal recognition particle receptor
VRLWPFGRRNPKDAKNSAQESEQLVEDLQEPTSAADDKNHAQDDAASASQQNPQQSMWSRLTSGLAKSTDQLGNRMRAILQNRRLDESSLDDLEEQLIMADLGVAAASAVIDKFRAKKFPPDAREEDILEGLAEAIAEILQPCEVPLDIPDIRPATILMVGVNGTGKTTTIGKLTSQLKDAGYHTVLGAADTFRAAAIEQLTVWGTRNDVPVVARAQGADAAAVAFDTMTYASDHQMDVAIIDTAGRLQNKTELMDELTKIRRVVARARDHAPDHTLLVLDATTGQNALLQVEAFQQAAQISGLVITKLDGSARGGVVVALAQKYQLPIHAIGVGEAVHDLQPFVARDFARALVGLSRHKDNQARI